MLQEKLGSWYEHLKIEFTKPYMKKLSHTLKGYRDKRDIFPTSEDIFRCFSECPTDKLKVVLVAPFAHWGQVSYADKAYPHADGLAFSCNINKKINGPWYMPASTEVLVTSIEKEYNIEFPPRDPDLSDWAQQGVLLLNTVLTTEVGKPGSHKDLGWETFTQQVLKVARKINPECPIVLFGSYSKQVFDRTGLTHFHFTNHPQLQVNNPMLESYRFDARVFKVVDRILKSQNKEIEWL